MAFSFAPTYQDYRNYYDAQHGNASEGGGGGYLSADQWGALDSGGQWGQLGGGMALGSDDPRWAEMAQQLGIAARSGPDATVMVYGGPKPSDLSGLVDPSRVLAGDGSYAFAHSNFTPQAEFAGGGMSDSMWGLAALALIGGGAAFGGALGGGAGAGTGATTTGGFSGFGDIAAGGGLGAGEGVGTGGLAGGLAGDESAGLSMTNPFAAPGEGQFAGLSSGVGNPYGPGAFDASGFTGTSLDPALSGSSNLLSRLNQARQYVSRGRQVMGLLNGGGSSGSGRSGMSGNTSDILSLILGGNSGSGSNGGFLGGLLGLLGAGHQAFGNGIGTPNGAMDVANRASALADPWAAYRQPFQQAVADHGMDLLGLGRSPADQITENPAYQFELQQGTNAINTGDAAQGTLRSGNRLTELQRYGTGLASTFWQQNQASNLANLGALGGLAGVNAGSPVASAGALLGGWDNASNLRNSGINGLFGGGRNNPLFGSSGGGLLGMLGQAGSGIYNWLTGGNGGFDMSSVDFGNLPAFNDTSGFNPGDFFTDDGGGFADATGAFF